MNGFELNKIVAAIILGVLLVFGVGKFMEEVVDAGIDFIRISIIGYNKEKYKQWMNVDNFELIKQNITDQAEILRVLKW